MGGRFPLVRPVPAADTHRHSIDRALAWLWLRSFISLCDCHIPDRPPLPKLQCRRVFRRAVSIDGRGVVGKLQDNDA
jgi:hypothetical protein